jgi:predicted  nucleic acid-binding Zn-ribbon protein
MRSYETDYAGWAEDQAAAIRERRWSDVDEVALADEVGDLARKERRALRNRLVILLAHLLKQRYQAEKASRSWQATVDEQRLRIREILEESPSLRAQLNDAILSAYAIARLRAVRETQLPVETFPVLIPFSDEDLGL